MPMTENSSVSEVISYIKRLKETQTKIYGIMSHGLVPEELIYAADGFPLRLSLTGDKSSATQGIEYLTSATCSFARSTIGHFELKNELYSELDAIIAGNYCNGEICTTELISEYFRIPRINIVFPSTKSESALKFQIAELNHFKEDIERFSGNQITNTQISEAIQIYNQERKLIQEVVKIQAEKGVLLSGVECSDLIYKHFLYGVKAAIENLQKVLMELKDRSSILEAKRIIFAGAGVPIGDDLIHLIENHGLLVIKNLTWTGLDYYNSLIDENIAPLEGLANFYINNENSGRMILSDNFFTNLVDIYEDCNADGILFYIIKYCSIFPSVISMKLKQTLSEKEIPYLELERDYAITTEAQLQTRLQAFKEMIG